MLHYPLNHCKEILTFTSDFSTSTLTLTDLNPTSYVTPAVISTSIASSHAVYWRTSNDIHIPTPIISPSTTHTDHDLCELQHNFHIRLTVITVSLELIPLRTLRFPDKWAPVKWPVPRLWKEKRPPVWRVAANILNKQSRTA